MSNPHTVTTEPELISGLNIECDIEALVNTSQVYAGDIVYAQCELNIKYGGEQTREDCFNKEYESDSTGSLEAITKADGNTYIELSVDSFPEGVDSDNSEVFVMSINEIEV